MDDTMREMEESQNWLIVSKHEFSPAMVWLTKLFDQMERQTGGSMRKTNKQTNIWIYLPDSYTCISTDGYIFAPFLVVIVVVVLLLMVYACFSLT